MTILTEADLRRCVQMDRAAIEAVAEGFTALAEGRATVPPVVRVDIPAHYGEVDIKTAYIEGLDSFAVKVASGFFENYKLGLPSGSGLMLLWSARTGVPEAVLLDNGYLTHIRTGAAGALAAKYLAREQIETAGVMGAGDQARYQMIALRQVRDFKRILVFNRTEARLEQYIADMTRLLGVEVVPAKSAEEVVRRSDVVVTATPSTEPYLRAAWLHPGLHITAMGADGEHKQELSAEVLVRADICACDLKSQVFEIGEHQHALAAGVISRDDPVVELGELTGGQKVGRTGDAQITVCDLTGVGVQDTAIALFAYRRAGEMGLGMRIEV
ncbi:MAG: cyclodeaminase [Anaerolineae bacterium]|nr:cyclodeaminase [Anaerolineae bacterium]